MIFHKKCKKIEIALDKKNFFATLYYRSHIKIFHNEVVEHEKDLRRPDCSPAGGTLPHARFQWGYGLFCRSNLESDS